MFGEKHAYTADEKYNRTIFGRPLETPIGPAAGPNTQLTQNIVAAYYTGSRFFELKTVQKMDGAELAACINKPCIKADDECYNCEWSTELYVPQAMEEYIKAWFLLKAIFQGVRTSVRQTASSSISASDMIWQAFSPRRSIHSSIQ